MASGLPCPTAFMRIGFGAAAGSLKWARTGTSAMGPSTSPAPASSTQWAALSLSPALYVLDLELENMDPMGSRALCPVTISHLQFSARSYSRLDGLDLIRVPH